MNGELAATLDKEGLDLAQSPITAARLAALVGTKIAGSTLSKLAGGLSKLILGKPAEAIEQIIEEKGLQQITDTGAIEAMIDEVLANNAKAIEQFKSGNEKSAQCFGGAGDEGQQRQGQPHAGAGIDEGEAGLILMKTV